MDYQSNQDYDFSSVVDTLVGMFGDVLSKDVIFTVVESCGGDLSLAAEAVMNISNDTTTMEPETKPTDEINSPKHIELAENRSDASTFAASQENEITNQHCFTYAGVSQSTGAFPKHKQNPILPKAPFWTDQLRQIMTYHNQGSRILIFMRGVPGSGKSYLAKQLVEMMIGSTFVDFKTHICSTDDFFMVGGVYRYDRFRLRDAHDWNQKRVRAVLKQGLSPLIIDNTNIEIWEMEPYLREGVKNGYIIEVVEPNTPWARKAHQLVKKNTHNVPIATIKRMLDNYQDGITGKFLLSCYGLSYPAGFVPPVSRKMPVFISINEQNNVSASQSVTMNNETNSVIAAQSTSDIHQLKIDTDEHEISHSNLIEHPSQSQDENFTEVQTVNSEYAPYESNEEIAMNQRYLEIQKQLEEMEKVDQEWDNGDTWDNESQETVSASSCDKKFVSLAPKPPRRNAESMPGETILDTVKKCEDWRQISMFMPPWNENTILERTNTPEAPVEMKSSSTFMEIGDTDPQSCNKTMKIITATPRDINLFSLSFPREKIPEKRMLDKSTMTNELLLVEAYRCKNEEQHFIAFRKLFKNVPKAALRDIFDKCCGDVNWAVDIVLEGMANNQLETLGGEGLSDTEAENQEQCNCLAAYDVVPNTQQTELAIDNDNNEAKNCETPNAVLLQKKQKIAPSETSVQLKRQIEQNVFISDDYYSKHCLEIRKMLRGECIPEADSLQNKIDEYLINNEVETEDNILPSTSRGDVAPISDEESNTSNNDEVEKTVNIKVGMEFLSQLDDLFGRKNMTYPDYVTPNVKIPISLLIELNAFWVESLMFQLDQQDRQSKKMLDEDAEFARQLAMKEKELAQAGKEPDVPDFKEIMDMDFAISLYQKDVAEWRNKEPDDMAAKMSRDKLYNLFPDTAPDILAELLMAHDNNFQATVEVLLMSTGKSHILEETNGLNKFVMEKEMERQEKLLEEQKKALSEVDWPLLPTGEKVEMTVVDNYREEAKKHLASRNSNYMKAQEYIRRGMTQVANYYSDVANFHKQKYEQANSMAALSLIQVHASNSPDNATIDLHYLRVGEAKESLDLFLDTHIQKLRESSNQGQRHHTLFFITGRGLHSNGRPRVKPAVIRRLRERGLIFHERNPGLLTAKVCADDKLSYQVQVP